MPISILNYNSKPFQGKGLLDGIKSRWSLSDVDTVYRPASNANAQALADNLWDALRAYDQGTRSGAVARTKDGTVAEMETTDGAATQVIFLEKPSLAALAIKVQAGTVTGKKNAPVINKNYTFAISGVAGSIGFKGTAVLLALMPFILKDDEARETYDKLKNYLIYDENDKFWSDEENKEDFAKLLTKLSSNIYYRIKNPVATGTWTPHSNYVPAEYSLRLQLDTQADVKGFTAKKLTQKLTDIKGKFKYVQNTSTISIGTKYYLTPEADMTEEEKRCIPVMPKWYRMQEWTIDFARRMKLSSKFPNPIRTGFLLGPAGTGKTEGCKALFSLLGIRHTLITCHADMELMDFVGMLIPQGGDKPTSWVEVMKEKGLPNTDDIMNDPKSSYIRIYKQNSPAVLNKSIFELTDEENDEIKRMQDKMLRDVMDICFTEINNRVSSGQYNYVEGPLIQACRNGWGIEIQEAGIIKRAGVVVGLNALLESGENNMITLQTGEVVKKHPNTVIMFTSNDDYIGTASLNQSVISRMALVQWFQNPTLDELVSRVTTMTGFSNKGMLTKMARCVTALSESCKDKEVTDGSVGLRELINWTMAVMCDAEEEGIDIMDVTNEMVGDAAIATVLGKISQVCESAEEVIDAVMNATDFGVRTLRV